MDWKPIKGFFSFFLLHFLSSFLSLLLGFLWTLGFLFFRHTPMQGGEDILGDADPNLAFDLKDLGLETLRDQAG